MINLIFRMSQIQSHDIIESDLGGPDTLSSIEDDLVGLLSLIHI